MNGKMVHLLCSLSEVSMRLGFPEISMGERDTRRIGPEGFIDEKLFAANLQFDACRTRSTTASSGSRQKSMIR